MSRIYLDNAATSWPKPEAVYAEMDSYLRRLGAAAGRSVYQSAIETERLVANARKQVAEFLNAESPQRLIFTSSGTDSLNLAIHGLVQAGDHVVTTVAEHNSVLRPLQFLSQTQNVEVTYVPVDGQGIVDPVAFAAALKPKTRCVILTHASNVTGAVQPVADVVAFARENGVLSIVDAAQTVGHLAVDVQQLNADILAAPGHKGLLGPTGTGILYVRPDVEQLLRTIRQGGTGTVSQDVQQPDTLPDKYESGNHNVAGIVGLGQGVKYLLERGLSTLRQHETELTSRLLDGLRSIGGVTCYGAGDAESQVGVVSITIDGLDPQEIAMMLDSAAGIEVRAGLHCAPLMHKTIGTLPQGGTVRFSVGPFTTAADIDRVLEVTRQFAATA